jgi:hypothetical protein
MKNKAILFIPLCFFLIAFFLRVYKLSALSPVVAHDEMYYLTEAKTLSLSGKDPFGKMTPLSLKPSNPLFAELPATIMVPAALVFSNNPVLAGRVTHVVIGTLFCIVLAAVVYLLFRKKDLAVITLLVTAFNPWFFQNSRMSFDALFSLFFYFLGILLVLLKQKKFLPVAFLAFFLGFYQYQGLKIILIPMVFTVAVYVSDVTSLKKFKFKNFIKEQKWLLLFLFCISLLFVWQVARLKTTSAADRVNDLVFFDQNLLSSRVNQDRLQSVDSKFTSLFTNKLTAMFSIMGEKYLDSFQLGQLFLKVDARRNPFAVSSKGVFHLIDLPLLLLGIGLLLKENKWRRQGLLILAMILIAPIPSAINGKDTWLFFRSSFLFPWLIILISLGFYKLLKWKKIIFGGVVGLYTLAVVFFMYDYFVRYPIYGTADRYFAERVLASYIQRLSTEKKAEVLAEEPFFFYSALITLTNSINKNNIAKINSAFVNEEYQINSWLVDSRCYAPSKQADDTVTIVDSRNALCDGEKKPDATSTRILQIPSLIDNGSLFSIYNDSLCGQYSLDRFVHVTANKMSVEDLSDEDFCHTFITVN